MEFRRKYAIPLLEFLDRERVTRRTGDVRLVFMRPVLLVVLAVAHRALEVLDARPDTLAELR